MLCAYAMQAAGVELSPKGGIKVNDVSRTNVPSVWAIGDVTERIALSECVRLPAGCLAWDACYDIG